MAVTAEGVFRIIDKASGPIDKIATAASKMDKHVKGAGKTLDDLDSRKVTQSIQTTEKNTKSLGDTTETMGKKVTKTTEQVSKDYERMAGKGIRSLETLTAALKRFEHERATAQVDIDIAKAEAKIRLIKQEIRTFTTLQARKELDSLGLSAMAATAALAGSGAGGGGGGSPGGGGGIRRGLAGGFFAAGGRAAFMGAALLAALPAIVAVTGAVSALVGSLGAAVGGAGALGVGTLGAFITGVIAIVTVARPAIQAIKEQKQAQDAYNKSVEQYGKASAQAAEARKALDSVNRQNPGAATFNRNRQVVGERFRAQTAGARQDFFGILNEGLRTANSLLPVFSRVVNQVMDASRVAVEDFMRPFRGREWKGIIATLGDTFARSIGPAARGLGSIALFFGRISRAASPMVIRMFERFESWTKNLAQGVSNQAQAEQGIGKLVGHLRDWVRMGGAAVRLMAAFFGAGAGQGQTIVQGITEQLNKWTQWIEDNPGKIQDFFTRTIESTGKLVHALGEIAKVLGQIGDALLPVLNLFSDLTSAAGGAGILGPLAAIGAARFAFGKRSGGIFGRGGAAAGGAGTAAAAGAGAAAAAATRRIPAAATMGRSGLGGAAKTGVRAVGKLAGPLALAMAGWDFATYRGNVAERGQAALSGATFGLIPRPVSKAEHRVQGSDAAAAFVDRDPSAQHLRGRISALESSLAARSTRTVGGGAGALATTSSVLKLRGGERQAVQAQLDALKPVLRATVKLEGQEKANRAIDDLMQAFDTRWQKAGSKAAQTGLIHGIRRQMATLGVDGDKALLTATARWTGTMEAGTKAQRRIAERTKTEIVAQFKSMGQDVRVINGNILDISRAKWAGVRAAITTESERARQEGRRAFTDLQRAAVDALRLMGFTPGQSKSLVQGIEKGGAAGAVAKSDAAAGPSPTQLAATDRKTGTGDGIGYTGDGPGQGRRGEMARASSGINLMGASAGLAPYAQDAQGFGLRVSSGARPGAVTSSGNRSWHASGRALDLAGSPADMLRFFNHAKNTYGSRLEELIYTPGGIGVKNGQPHRYTGKVAADHFDHVHLADAQDASGVVGSGGGVGGGVSMDGSPIAGIRLPRGKSAVGGVLGEASRRAQDIIAAAMGEKINAAIGAGGGAASAGASGELNRIFPRHIGPKRGATQLTPAQVMAIAQSVGLPGRAFEQIAHGESNYFPGIQQPDPGDGMVGYGLWQMTPNAWGRGSAARKHMDSLGGIPAMFNPYKNAQMAKFLYDAAGRNFSPWYGTRYLTDAAKKQGDGIGMTVDGHGGGKVDFGGWYGGGGAFTVHRPTLIGVGDGGAERVIVKPQAKGGSGGRRPEVTVIIKKIVNYEEGDIQEIVERELAAVAANLDFGADDDDDELG